MLSAAKRAIRRVVVPWALSNDPLLIVASSGRAGSTMLFDAVTDSLIQVRLGWSRETMKGRVAARSISGYVERIAAINDEPYAVYKTHDIFSTPPSPNYRIVFVYGDPLDSAMSVSRVVQEKGADWFAQHQYHLHATGSFSNLFQEDVLNFAGQMRSWLGKRRDDVLCIEYEDLWNSRTELSGFLGFDINLPARRPRETVMSHEHVNHELFAALRALKDKLKYRYEKQNVG